MTALPAERDLPPAARDAARARTVAAVTPPAAPARRWIPLAAAAGLAAVVAASAVAVAAYRSDPAPTPAATASPTGPSRARLLAECARYTRLDALARRLGDTSPTQVRAVWQDRYGYQLSIGSAKMLAVCSFAPDGTPLPGAGSSGAYSGYLDRPGEAIVVGMYGTASAARDRLGYFVTGRVRRGVARVVVTWPGAAPVTAALEGPYFIARVTFPGQTGVDRRAEIVAYDAAGTALGRYSR